MGCQFWSQVVLLMRNIWTHKRNNWKTTLLELLVPLYPLIFLYFIVKLDFIPYENNHYKAIDAFPTERIDSGYAQDSKFLWRQEPSLLGFAPMNDPRMKVLAGNMCSKLGIDFNRTTHFETTEIMHEYHLKISMRGFKLLNNNHQTKTKGNKNRILLAGVAFGRYHHDERQGHVYLAKKLSISTEIVEVNTNDVNMSRNKTVKKDKNDYVDTFTIFTHPLETLADGLPPLKQKQDVDVFASEFKSQDLGKKGATRNPLPSKEDAVLASGLVLLQQVANDVLFDQVSSQQNTQLIKCHDDMNMSYVDEEEIDTAFNVTKWKSFLKKFKLERMPTPETSKTQNFLRIAFSVFVGAMFVSLQAVMSQIAFECSSGMKEQLLLKGMDGYAYISAWFFAQTAVSVINAFTISIMLNLLQIIHCTEIWFVFVTFFLYALAQTSFAIALPVMAGESVSPTKLFIFGMILLTAGSGLFFVVKFLMIDKGMSSLVFRSTYILYIIPFCILLFQLSDADLRSYSVVSHVHYGENSEAWYALAFIVADTFLYLLLAYTAEGYYQAKKLDMPFCRYFLYKLFGGRICDLHRDGYVTFNETGQYDGVCVNNLCVNFHNRGWLPSFLMFPFQFLSGIDPETNIVRAVQDLSFHAPSGQIVAILGMNGAGKTTTLKTLTGVIMPTHGDAWVDGMHVVHDRIELRKSIGSCPQNDILFEKVSCFDHLVLFSRIAGNTRVSAEAEANVLLRELELDSKRNELAGNLSGGQRRRLSLAIALVGDPRIVVVDEATTGTDPKNRRNVWRLLQDLKNKGKVVLMTSHQLDEADLLADQVVVLSKGKLVAMGSPDELKLRYGSGNSLRIVLGGEIAAKFQIVGGLQPIRIQTQLNSFVKGYFPRVIVKWLGAEGEFTLVTNSYLSEVKRTDGKTNDLNKVSNSNNNTTVDRSIGNRVRKLPSVETTDNLYYEKLVQLFRELENFQKEKRYGIVGFGISPPTLEQVFVTVGGRNELSEEETKAELQGPPLRRSNITSESEDDISELSELKDEFTIPFIDCSSDGDTVIEEDLQECSSLFRQFYSVLVFVTIRSSRAPAVWMYIVLWPIIMSTVAGIIDMNIKSGPNLPVSMVPDYFKGSFRIPYAFAGFGTEIDTLMEENFVEFENNLDFENLCHFGRHFIGSQLAGKCFRSERSLRQHLLNARSTKLPETAAIVLSITPLIKRLNGLFEDYDINSNSSMQFLLKQIRGGTILFNHSKTGSSRIVLQHLWNIHTGTSNKGKEFPFRVTAQYEEWKEVKPNDFSSGGLVYFVAIVFALLSANFCEEMVRFRVTSVKDQLIMAGLPRWLFFFSNIVAHVFLTLCAAMICVAIMYICNMDGPRRNSPIAYIFAFGTFAPAAVVYGYCFSYLVDSVEAAQEGIAEVQNLLLSICWLLVSFGFKNQNLTAENWFSLLPGFGLYRCLAILETMPKVGVTFQSIHEIFLWDNIFVQPLLIMFVDWFIWAFLLVVLEVSVSGEGYVAMYKEYILCLLVFLNLLTCRLRRFLIFPRMSLWSSPESSGAPVLSSDVERETGYIAGQTQMVEHVNEITNIGYRTDNPIIWDVRNVSKSFTLKDGSRFDAVKDVSLQVKLGAICAILGPNGAGKSTLIECMTGRGGARMDSGDALVNGHSVRVDLDAARRYMGFCPQHNVIIDLLTAREHMRLFARLRGLHSDVIEKEIQFWLDAMGMDSNTADRYAGTYSGGNKRKLCLAMSLVGKCNAVVQDEGTAGMDVLSRRKVWDSLQQTRARRALIITTHAMEEADALADEIIIIINGRKLAEGSNQLLKQKFGESISVTLILSKENIPSSCRSLDDFVKEYIHPLAQSETKPRREGFRTGLIARYEIPRKNTTLSEVFEGLLLLRNKCPLVLDFSVSQTTLEDVFLRMVREEARQQNVY